MKHNLKGKRRESVLSVAILLPSIILVAIFIYGFVGLTLYTSLTDWGSGAGLSLNPVKNFIGFDNYKELFTGFLNARFRQDLLNALFYTIFLLIGTLCLGLFLAILLDRPLRAEAIFRTIFLYPMALSFIVTGTIWRWLVAPNGGLNLIPKLFGLKKGEFLWTSSRTQIFQFNWQTIILRLSIILFFIFAYALFISLKKKNKKSIITNSIATGLCLLYALLYKVIPPPLAFEETHGFNLATVGIIIAGVWQYAGYAMALYLAGLRGLPTSIKESAKLDGASEALYYMKIALPNMKPITLSAIVIMSHISLKLFDLIYAMAGADNANTGHPSINMYLTTFRANNFAIGAAIAVILFLLAALFIIPYMIHTHKTRRNS